MNQKHAVIYDRASTKKQKGNWSRKDAARIGGELAERNGYTWELRPEVKSGKGLADRPVMMQLLEDIRAGKVKAIICQDIDRLGRPEERYNADFIKTVCLENDCLIITADHIYNLENDSDDILADTKFMIAKFERRNTIRRITRAMAEKSRAGGFNGGHPPLGYQLVYSQPTREGERPLADLGVLKSERKLAELIFEYYIKNESATTTAKRLNLVGYRGKRGALLSSKTIVDVIKNPIYAGFLTWGREKKSRHLRNFEQPMFFRPELQIIPVEVWEKANEIRERRYRHVPKWAVKHIFTGFIACATCGGAMCGTTHEFKDGPRVQYRCINRMTYGPASCKQGKSYTEYLIAQAVIPFMADLIARQIGLENSLNQAAAQYGRTITEAELQQKIEAELHQTKEAKKRVVNSIAAGVLSENEASETMTELREQEQRLGRELATIGQKTKIRSDYLAAVKALKNANMLETLWDMSETQPTIFRKMLKLIFEPNSIKIQVDRKGNIWTGYLDDYTLTEACSEVTTEKDNMLFGNHRLSDGFQKTLILDLSELLTEVIK